MLANNLLRNRDSDSTVKGGLTVKREKQLAFIEGPGIEMYTMNFDTHIAMIEGRGDGELAAVPHTSYGGSYDGTEALCNQVSIQF
jgi:hypothetical protein